jgi:hypothetical protein
MPLLRLVALAPERDAEEESRMAKSVKRAGAGGKATRRSVAASATETSRDKEPFSLGPVVDVLHSNLTEAMCEEVFDDLRTTERRREWTLFALCRFWVAVVLDAPTSLTQALERTRGAHHGAHALLPTVEASNSAFFERCKNLSSSFFAVLYRSFVERILPEAPTTFAEDFGDLRTRFRNVLLIDGSRLDRIAHRLKVLWPEKAVVLPGCLIAVYDVFRGIAVHLSFSADAAESEFNRALLAIEQVEEGSLIVGDRLYCSRKLFHFLSQRKIHGLFRRTKALKYEEVRQLSTKRENGVAVEDWLVRSGSGSDVIELRSIRLQKEGKTYEALTNDLDPSHLTVDDAINLYPLRWQVERLFFDMKVVLNLKKLYAANPNAVAMQVFATALVHAAFRVAQARIAKDHELPPEELSPKKLFPLLAIAAIVLLERDVYFEEIQDQNPGGNLKKPDAYGHRALITTLRAIRVQRRKGPRKPPEYSKERATWKSLAHVDPKAFDLS